MSRREVKLVLQDEQPMSWNKIYAGKHWTHRQQEADRVHQLVRSAIDPDKPMFDCIVDIEMYVYFKNRRVQQDASNIAAKFYEDGLIGWIIEDDSPQYVRSVKTVSLLDRANPRVEIIVRAI